MERALTYQDGDIKESFSIVSEKQEQYTQDLGNAIERYIEQLRDIELRCAKQNGDGEDILREITALNDSMLRTCAKFEQEVTDKNAIKTARSYFRKRTHPILSKGNGINRLRTWPRGYQGDYLTLEAAYRDTPFSDGIGYYLDRYILSLPLAVALRERIKRLGEILRDELTARQNPKVLDIACGSCREILGLVPEIKASDARFTCVDLDSDALDFALSRLAFTGLHDTQIEFIKYNALRMFDYETAMAEFGPQDVIYSVGYFDYLPDDFLVKLLNSLYMLLNPGGKLIAAFKDANRYRPQEYHWIIDWDGFLQRTEPDFKRLLHDAGIPSKALSTTRDKTGTIVFYTAVK